MINLRCQKNQTFENGFSKMLRQNFRQEKKIDEIFYVKAPNESYQNPEFYWNRVRFDMFTSAILTLEKRHTN